MNSLCISGTVFLVQHKHAGVIDPTAALIHISYNSGRHGYDVQLKHRLMSCVPRTHLNALHDPVIC